MSNIFKNPALPLFLSLVSITAPVGAVSFDRSWYVARYNTAGTSYAVMVPTAGHFCYLRRIYMVEADIGGEYTMCNLVRGSTSWVLEATLGKTSDADVQCGAYCFSY